MLGARAKGLVRGRHDNYILIRRGSETRRPTTQSKKLGKKLAQLFEAGGIDYFNAKRLMLITSRTPDPVMVKA